MYFNTSMRLFTAIELSAEIRHAIASQAASLRTQWADPARRWRWVSPDQFHLTLKFLGDTPEASLSLLQDSLSRVSAGFPGFSMTFSGFGCFGRGKDLQVLWLGVQDGSDRCRQLADRINEGLDAVGFKKETRPFHPHITLARAKPGSRRTARPSMVPVSLTRLGLHTVNQVALFRSTLTPRGPLYEVIERFALGPP
jgi:RNA 2',3'-cyclic 3'-phosphodiesterase